MPDQSTNAPGQNISPEKAAELFKERFVDLIADMGTNVHKDPKTLFLIGSLATRLVEEAKKTSWARTKAALSRDAYNSILETLRVQGNQLAAKGDKKASYAAEILAISIIAPTMRADEHIATGNDLLDSMIEDTIKMYRQRAGIRSN